MARSGEPLENPRHLFFVVRPKRGGTYVAKRADLQKVGAKGFVVRRLEDGDHVVGTDGPVRLLQRQPMLLGYLAAAVGTLEGLLDVSDTLLGPVHQDHIAGHLSSSLSPEEPGGSPTSPIMPARGIPRIRRETFQRIMPGVGVDQVTGLGSRSA